MSWAGREELTARERFLFVVFIFLALPFLSPPQSGAGKGKLTRSLAVCEESARPGGESLQDQVYPLSFSLTARMGSVFVCMSRNPALHSVLGEKKNKQRKM